MTVIMVATNETMEERIHRLESALNDPRWDFRTVESIARDTALSAEEVKHLLHEHGDRFRRSYLTQGGEPLYALHDKRQTWRERFAELRDFLASPLSYNR